MLTGIMKRVLGLDRGNRIYTRAIAHRGDRSLFQALADEYELVADFDERELERIPAEDSLIVVSNHPTGLAEGLLVPALIDAVRTDLKPLAHTWFEQWPEVAERSVLLDPQAKGEARRANHRSLREAASWVRSGHSLLVFPAGEVAHYRFGAGVVDRTWQPGLTHLLRVTRASVLPVRVEARSNILFHVLATLLPRVAALVLFRVLFGQRRRPIRIRIGNPIRRDQWSKAGSQEELLAGLREALEGAGAPCLDQKSLEPKRRLGYAR